MGRPPLGDVRGAFNLPRPGFFPLILGIIVALLGLVMLVRPRSRTGEPAPSGAFRTNRRVESVADEIVLENGNVLTGTVEKVEKDTMILKTDFYPKSIEIQVAKIKKITTENPVEIHLATGEILKGKLMAS